jgi:hypothetical protein
MLRLIILATFVVGFASCSARTQSYSEAGREFARRLCAIQNDCGCADDVIIPDCEAQVEQEFTESERRALEDGLVYDAECMEVFLERIDELGACGVEYPEPGPPCAVYGGDADVGDPCEVFDTMPIMSGCRIDLACIDGTCTDLENQAKLPLGAICSADQHIVPTGNLGECDEGLRCDSADTRACVAATPIPQAPLGEECVQPYGCVDDGICRPQVSDPAPSEERPGICVERTPPGDPCTLVYECDRICEAGRCQEAPPVLCDILRNWWVSRELF